MGKFWVVFLILIGLSLGCGGKGVKTTRSDPEVLYREGLVRFNKRDYAEALKRFQELKANFPDSPPYSHWAELKVADCHFLMKEYVEAIAAYEEFKKIHPAHEEIPYVQYQIGMSYFNQMLSYDRDQTATKKALSNFEYLVANFPPSLFTERAKEKIEICRDRLAAQEFYIAHYYYKQRNYGAASLRFQEFLTHFPKRKNEDEVLLLLGKSLLGLKQEEKAREVLQRMVAEYPQSPRSGEAKRLIEETLKKETKKEVQREAEPEFFPLTKYEEERRVSVPLQSPLSLPVRKINPHPRVEMELEFTPEEEKRKILTPAIPGASGKGNPKMSDSPFRDEARWQERQRPIEITSDRVEAYRRENRILFEGNVIARQEDVILYADSLEVIAGSEGKEIETVVASGHVKVQQGSRVGTSQKAIFHQPGQRLVLTGDPKVVEGENMVSGEEIIFDMVENRVKVMGGVAQRAKVVVNPRKGFEKMR